jgi:anti-sigma factor RsiW
MKEVACISGVELLMDFLEGTLPPDVRAALEAHVAECERCAAFVASYCETPRILRDATTMTLPDDIEASLKAFVKDFLQKNPRRAP